MLCIHLYQAYMLVRWTLTSHWTMSVNMKSICQELHLWTGPRLPLSKFYVCFSADIFFITEKSIIILHNTKLFSCLFIMGSFSIRMDVCMYVSWEASLLIMGIYIQLWRNSLKKLRIYMFQNKKVKTWKQTAAFDHENNNFSLFRPHQIIQKFLDLLKKWEWRF